MASRLSKLHGQEVSAVPKAANRRRFLLLKGDTPMLDEVKALQTIEALDKAGAGELFELLSEKPERGVEVVTFLKAGGNAMKCASCGAAVASGTDTCPECGKATKVAKAAIKKNADGSYDLSAIPEDQRPAIETMLKAADTELATTKAELEKSDAERRRLADEHDRTVYLAKANAIKGLPGIATEDLAVLLRKAAGGMGEDFGKLYDVLQKASSAVLGGALNELGSTLAARAGSAHAEVESKVADLRKADASLTIERARARVLKSNPDLFRRVSQELDEAKSARG